MKRFVKAVGLLAIGWVLGAGVVWFRYIDYNLPQYDPGPLLDTIYSGKLKIGDDATDFKKKLVKARQKVSEPDGVECYLFQNGGEILVIVLRDNIVESMAYFSKEDRKASFYRWPD